MEQSCWQIGNKFDWVVWMFCVVSVSLIGAQIVFLAGAVISFYQVYTIGHLPAPLVQVQLNRAVTNGLAVF